MFLFITTLKQQSCQQNFMCQVSSLVEAFDFLNTIVKLGDTLISARIADQGSVIQLPVEAFDGHPVGDLITALQQEWERILKQPLRQPSLPSIDDELYKRWLRARQTREGNLRTMIDATQHLWRIVQTAMPECDRKTRLLFLYQSIINRTKTSLDRLQSQVAAR